MSYYPKIDGLRFIAIVAVLLHHLASIFSTYIDLGYFGVDLFFVISGFLITSILLETKENFKLTYLNFLARRSLRIFPLYYFALLLLVIIGHPVVLREIGYLLSYTFNYRFPLIEEANPVGHFWSLAVEEQYYLFWPIIILGLKNHLKVLISIVILMIIFAYAQISFSIIPSISIYNYTGLPTRMGSLGLGSLGAMLFLKPKGWFIFILKSKSIEYGMFLIWLFAIWTLNPFLMGLGSLFLVLKAAEDSFHFQFFNKLLSHKFILHIARISYGIYVYHIIVNYYFTPYIFDPIWNQLNFQTLGKFSILKYHSWLIKLPLYTLITIGIAELSFCYFERPLLKLKDHYFKKNA